LISNFFDHSNAQRKPKPSVMGAGERLDFGDQSWGSWMLALDGRTRDYVELPANLPANGDETAEASSAERMMFLDASEMDIEAAFVRLLAADSTLAIRASDAFAGWSFLMALCAVAPRNAVPAARALLRAGADPDHRALDGATALLAASSGLQPTIHQGAFEKHRCEPPFFGLPQRGLRDAPQTHRVSTELVELLLAHGANPNHERSRLSCISGCTPLHWAASDASRSARALLALLSAGANPNAENREGQTPAHWAAMHGADANLSILINAGADLALRSRTPLGATPRGAGILMGRLCEQTLALIDARLKVGREEGADMRGGGLLHAAAGVSRPFFHRVQPDAMCARLLAAGADLEAVDEQLATPLWRAISTGMAKTLQFLLDSGAIFSAITPPADFAPPLPLLAQQPAQTEQSRAECLAHAMDNQPLGENAKKASLLLNLGVDIDALGHDGRSAFNFVLGHMPVWERHTDHGLAFFLFTAGASFGLAGKAAVSGSEPRDNSAENLGKEFFSAHAVFPSDTRPLQAEIEQAKALVLEIAQRHGDTDDARRWAILCVSSIATTQCVRVNGKFEPFDAAKARAVVDALELRREVAVQRRRSFSSKSTAPSAAPRRL